MMKRLILFLTLPLSLMAQQGEETTLTLSHGTYREDSPLMEGVLEIEGMVFDLGTGKLIAITDSSIMESVYEGNGRDTRWMSPDPLVHDDETPYSFVGNNPVNYIDPMGLDKVKNWWGVSSRKAMYQKMVGFAENLGAYIRKVYNDNKASIGCNSAVIYRLKRLYRGIYGVNNVIGEGRLDFKPKYGEYRLGPEATMQTKKFNMLSNNNIGRVNGTINENLGSIYKSIPSQYKGKGPAGAMMYLGYATEVGDLWRELQFGAPVQLWTQKGTIVNFQNNKDKQSEDEELHGHSFIFTGYGYKKTDGEADASRGYHGQYIDFVDQGGRGRYYKDSRKISRFNDKGEEIYDKWLDGKTWEEGSGANLEKEKQ